LEITELTVLLSIDLSGMTPFAATVRLSAIVRRPVYKVEERRLRERPRSPAPCRIATKYDSKKSILTVLLQFVAPKSRA